MVFCQGSRVTSRGLGECVGGEESARDKVLAGNLNLDAVLLAADLARWNVVKTTVLTREPARLLSGQRGVCRVPSGPPPGPRHGPGRRPSERNPGRDRRSRRRLTAGERLLLRWPRHGVAIEPAEGHRVVHALLLPEARLAAHRDALARAVIVHAVPPGGPREARGATAHETGLGHELPLAVLAEHPHKRGLRGVPGRVRPAPPPAPVRAADPTLAPRLTDALVTHASPAGRAGPAIEEHPALHPHRPALDARTRISLRLAPGGHDPQRVALGAQARERARVRPFLQAASRQQRAHARLASAAPARGDAGGRVAPVARRHAEVVHRAHLTRRTRPTRRAALVHAAFLALACSEASLRDSTESLLADPSGWTPGPFPAAHGADHPAAWAHGLAEPRQALPVELAAAAHVRRHPGDARPVLTVTATRARAAERPARLNPTLPQSAARGQDRRTLGTGEPRVVLVALLRAPQVPLLGTALGHLLADEALARAPRTPRHLTREAGLVHGHTLPILAGPPDLARPAQGPAPVRPALQALAGGLANRRRRLDLPTVAVQAPSSLQALVREEPATVGLADPSRTLVAADAEPGRANVWDAQERLRVTEELHGTCVGKRLGSLVALPLNAGSAPALVPLGALRMGFAPINHLALI